MSADAAPEPTHEPAPRETPSRARRTFGPVVLLGLASAGLVAYAATKPWIVASAGSVSTTDAAPAGAGMGMGPTTSPLASALALVVLACWGVLLVLRGTVRRVVAVGAAVAAVATFVVTVFGPRTLTPDVVAELDRLSGGAEVSHGLTGWFTAATLASAVSVVLSVLAVRLVGSWPEMGSRYDRPDGAAASSEPTTNLELWKALDEGHDPTA